MGGEEGCFFEGCAGTVYVPASDTRMFANHCGKRSGGADGELTGRKFVAVAVDLTLSRCALKSGLRCVLVYTDSAALGADLTLTLRLHTGRCRRIFGDC